MLGPQPVEGPDEINRRTAIGGRDAEREVIVDLADFHSCTSAALKAHHVHIKVEQDGTKPACHALRVL